MDPTADWRRTFAEDPDLDEVESLIAELAEDDPAYAGASLSALSDDAFRALVLVEDDAPARERLLRPLAGVLDAALPATPPDSALDGLGVVRAATLRAAAGGGGDPGE